MEEARCRGLVVATACEKRKKVPEKIEERGDEGGDVGPSGGAQDIVD